MSEVTVSEVTVNETVSTDLSIKAVKMRVGILVCDAWGRAIIEKMRLPVTFTMDPCGTSVTFTKKIPDHDVPCPCGNPQEWILKYKDKH